MALRGFGSSGGLWPATLQHLSKPGDLVVDPPLLGFEAFDGGGEYLGSDFECCHVSLLAVSLELFESSTLIL